MKLTQDQIDILANGKLEENRFYLQGQLDRKQYLSINEVLNTIGLIWNKGKKAHIAEGITPTELKEALDDILDTGEVETLKETIKKFQFYRTPEAVADYIVHLAELSEDDIILEPSAGEGAIINAIFKANPEAYVFANELHKDRYEILKDDIRIQHLQNNDFLEFSDKERFTKIIMNPPFAKSQDVKHILKAYNQLLEKGRLVAIASASIKTREGKLYDEFRALNPEIYDLNPQSFKESGTLVNTVIVIINK